MTTLYCHVYYCNNHDINGGVCGFESEDKKMYYLHKINEDSVDLSFNTLYDLKAYKVVKKLEEFERRGEIMKELDYSKPICSISIDGLDTYILLPRTYECSYTPIGYDWFSIIRNEWNSCVCWKTKEEAVECYSNVRNCELIVNLK